MTTKVRTSHNARPWTAEEDNWLRANASRLTTHELAEHIGCSQKQVSRHLSKLGLAWIKQQQWNPAKEDPILREMAGKFSVRQISARLGRSCDAVVGRAQRLGLSLIWNEGWPEAKVEELRRLAKDSRKREIAAAMGKTLGAVSHKLRELGIRAKDGRLSQTPVAARRARVVCPKPPKIEKAPRERIGLPRVRTIRIVGQVKHCERCHAPVIDTPERWAEHNQRIHIAPIFAVPCSSRRIA